MEAEALAHVDDDPSLHLTRRRLVERGGRNTEILKPGPHRLPIPDVERDRDDGHAAVLVGEPYQVFAVDQPAFRLEAMQDGIFAVEAPDILHVPANRRVDLASLQSG